MSETRLSAIDVKRAEELTRHLEPAEALEAGILTPMAGTRPVRLFSLAEAERFLIVHDKQSVDANGTWATINYVDPASLSRWIAGTLADTELAAAIDEIVKTRKAYGFLVPSIKALLAERLAQCEELLAPVSVEQG
jgi:hypothetical protein